MQKADRNTPMPQFDDSIKEEIRSRIDIVSVVGRYVKLKPSGRTHKGLCPFHKEKTPSFHVDPGKGIFHCFGCHKGGDVFKFVEEMEGVGFREALTMLGDECGVSVKQARPEPVAVPLSVEASGQKPELMLNKTDLLRIHEFAAEFYYGNVKGSPQAVDYFKSRGLQPEIVREFRLGYAPEAWSALIDFCARKGIDAEALVTCGLAVSNETGRIYDRFRNRVIFPLFDLTGRVIGFAGRGMEEKAIPKYLNSPETLLYKKKLFLYGLDKARQSIKDADQVMVVEGYMDYLALYQVGIKNVVASSGTAFTEEHGALIGRFTKRIILLFDGDGAGQSAIREAILKLVPKGFDITTVTIPGDEDPDSYVKKYGKDAFLQLLDKAQSWSRFIITAAMQKQNTSTPAGKSAVIDALLPLLSGITDPVIAESFTKDVADMLFLDTSLVKRKIRPGHAVSDPQRQSSSAALQAFAAGIEGSFLHILIQKPEYIEEARGYVVPETLTDGLSGDIYSLLLEVYDQDRSLARLLDAAEHPDIKRTISFLSVKEIIEDHVHEELVQKIIHLRKKYLRSRQRECTILLRQEPHRSEELMRLLHDYTTQLNELDGAE